MSELTRAGYERAGRVAGAVEASAEAVYRGLPERQQALTRDLFRRMTAAGPDGRPARRRVSLAELRAGLPKGQRADVSAVLDAFARGRLVMLDADTAELAHDVLLEAWPRLRGWLEEDQSSLILYGQLAEDTARWRQDGKDSARLYRGVQLAAAREAARVWATDPGRYPALPAAEAEFLRASGRAGTRGRWGRRALAGALALLLIAALAGAGLAVRSARDSASRQRTENVSVRLAAQSTALEAADPATAALLAGAAWRIAPTAQARYSLLQSLAQPVRGVLAARAGAVTALAASPDGTTLAAGYPDGTIRLWDVASHRLISTATWTRAPLALAFTGGGKALVVAGPAAVGAWNLADTGQDHRAAAGRVAGQPPAELAGGHPVAFSPDGTTLATGGERRERPAVGRRHPAGDRRADELGPRAGRDGGVQPRRDHAGRGQQRRDDPAVGRGHPAGGGHARWRPGRPRSGRSRSARTGSSSPPAAGRRRPAVGCRHPEPAGRDDGDRGPGPGPVVQRGRHHAGRRGKRRAPSCGPSPPSSRPAPRWPRRVPPGSARWPSARACSPRAAATGPSSCGIRPGSTSPPLRSPPARLKLSGSGAAVFSARGDILAVSDGRGTGSGCGTS